MKRSCVLFDWTCVLLWATTSAGLAQPTGVRGYEAMEVPPLSGDSSTSMVAIDEFGRMVGESRGIGARGCVWVNGQLLALPVPPGAESVYVSGISPTTGVLVGYSRINSITHGVAWVIGSGLFVLDNLPGSYSVCSAATSNDSGYLVGSCSFPNRSALWPRLDPPIDLGTLGGRGLEYALDINERGEVVGSSANALSNDRPYLWRNGQMIDIGGEPYDRYGWAWGVNNLSEVVGGIEGFGPFHWRAGQRSALPSLGNCGASPNDINDAGIIAGDSNPDPQCRNGLQHAVVWERSELGFHLFDLNDWTVNNPGLRLVTAKDINEAGQMAAFGKYEDGRSRGFLVTPYRFEISDPVPGRAGTVNTITVTGLAPNQRVHLVWGTREGAQKIHGGCPGGTLLIRDPQALPAVRADANGVATITVNVPLIARGRTVRLQAVAPIECQISHTVTWTFE